MCRCEAFVAFNESRWRVDWECWTSFLPECSQLWTICERCILKNLLLARSFFLGGQGGCLICALFHLSRARSMLHIWSEGKVVCTYEFPPMDSLTFLNHDALVWSGVSKWLKDLLLDEGKNWLHRLNWTGWSSGKPAMRLRSAIPLPIALEQYSSHSEVVASTGFICPKICAPEILREEFMPWPESASQVHSESGRGQCAVKKMRKKIAKNLKNPRKKQAHGRGIVEIVSSSPSPGGMLYAEEDVAHEEATVLDAADCPGPLASSSGLRESERVTEELEKFQSLLQTSGPSLRRFIAAHTLETVKQVVKAGVPRMALPSPHPLNTSSQELRSMKSAGHLE